MATMIEPMPQPPDLGASYQALYDILKKMYWEASTLESKDEVHGVMEEVGEILDELDGEALQTGTERFFALQPRIAVANEALGRLQQHVATITRNINTAAKAAAAISRILALIPKLG